jgi:diguanylate cyclase (GGDEF)-like protein
LIDFIKRVKILVCLTTAKEIIVGFNKATLRELIVSLEMMFDGIAYVDYSGCMMDSDSRMQLFSTDTENVDKKKMFESATVEPSTLITAIRRSIDEHKLIVIDYIHFTNNQVFECRISPFMDGALILILDVTERKMAQDKLLESKRSKEVFFQNLPGMAYRCLYDREWTMLEVSEGCYDLTGYRAESFIHNRDVAYNDIINPSFRDTVWEAWEESVQYKRPFKMEYPIITITGESVWVLEQGVPVFDDNGNLVALEGLIINVSASKDKESQVNYLLTHDNLTGALNRQTYLQQKMRIDSDPTMVPVSILILDINGLKLINDAFGMRRGDLLLQETSRIIAKILKDTYLFARLGGDDFAVLMPHTDLATAEVFWARVQEGFSEYNMGQANDYDRIYVSHGIATKDYPDIQLESVQKLAEENMNKHKLLERKSSHSSIVESIKQSMHARSQETEAHSERLADLSKMVGLKMALSQTEISELALLATLHDIGKIGVNDQILNKPGKLTDEEWTQMRKHTEIGYRIAMSSPELISIADYILTHHERWDGKGYPQGLSGTAIPLISRILSVVDAYDAMTKDRVYRKAMSKDHAIEELKANAGSQFDPTVVGVFIEILERPDIG